MRKLSLLWIIVLSLSTAAAWADAGKGRVLFILDGSGSMWGQIEGRAKISIAKEVMVNLIRDLPETVQAGLQVYGHRVKGDCNDIELLSPIGQSDRTGLIEQIQSINPKGKTPITQSLVLAGEQLRETEEETSVVLISDGKETCDADPCALVRELRDQGIKVQVHVVGFDVNAEEREQLVCIAEAGGGKYFNADNTSQLDEALAEVKKEIEQTPKITFSVVDRDSGEPVKGEAQWTFINSETEEVVVLTGQAESFSPELANGNYEVFVLLGELSGQTLVEIEAHSSETFLIEVQQRGSAATLEAPGTAAAGSTIEVKWHGPDAKLDKIYLVQGKKRLRDAPTRRGNPVSLVAPADPGTYELLYWSYLNKKALARVELEVTPAEAALEAPRTAAAGSTIEVKWQGPDAKLDKIYLVQGNKRLRDAPTRRGNPVSLVVPADPGTYELLYWSYRNKKALARRALIVR